MLVAAAAACGTNEARDVEHDVTLDTEATANIVTEQLAKMDADSAADSGRRRTRPGADPAAAARAASWQTHRRCRARAGAGGARAVWDRGRYSAYVDGNAMYTTFDDYLLLDSRFAVTLQAGFRVRF